jgi:hypothetical protein
MRDALPMWRLPPFLAEAAHPTGMDMFIAPAVSLAGPWSPGFITTRARVADGPDRDTSAKKST